MKVYLIFNADSQQIEHIFKSWEDANKMRNSMKKTGRIFIEEHEVIE